MNIYEVELTTIAVVAAESAVAAAIWAVNNAGDITSNQDPEASVSSQIKTLGDLERVDNGMWPREARPYGLADDDARTICDLIQAGSGEPYRCPKTSDMFCGNPVTAGIDRDTTGAIGQP